MSVGNLALGHRSSWRTVRSLLCAGVLVLVAGAAFADTVRLTVDRVLVWSRPSGVAVVITQLSKDQIVEVVRRIGDWYEIVIPSASGRYGSGFIRVSQAEVVAPGTGSTAPESTGTPSAPISTPQGPPAASRAPQRRRSHAGFATLGAEYKLKGDEVVRVSEAFEDVYAEAGSLSARYLSEPAVGLDVMAGQTFRGPIGLGLGMSYHQRDAPASVQALVPHPFFFNQPRPAAFETGPLTTREVALHLPVLVMPAPNSRLRIVGFGGFTLFHVRQNAVTGATLADPYPHTTVTVAAAVTQEKKATIPGYHAGADVSYFFGNSTGVGAGVRYSRARLEFKNDEGATTTGHAGGVEVLAGLRFRF